MLRSQAFRELRAIDISTVFSRDALTTKVPSRSCREIPQLKKWRPMSLTICIR